MPLRGTLCSQRLPGSQTSVCIHGLGAAGGGTGSIRGGSYEVADRGCKSCTCPAAGSPEGRGSTAMTRQHSDRTCGEPQVEPGVKEAVPCGATVMS